MEGTSGKGGSEPSQKCLRIIDYEERLGGSIQHWSSANRTRRCNRCQNYSYTKHVVLAVVDERIRLRHANFRDQIEMKRMRSIMEMQSDRIQELQEAVGQEQERMDAMRQQVQVLNERLIRMLR